MKTFLNSRFLILLGFVFFVQNLYSDPLIVTLLMVKDEVHCIRETLEPLIKGGVKDFYLLDTGSTDGTQKIIRDVFAQYKVNGYLTEEPFVDFSTSRNRLIELAERQFPKANFFLMLDANWFVRNVPVLLDFCQKNIYSREGTYWVRVFDHSVECSYRSRRLFRASSHVRYSGKVHEVPSHQSWVYVSSDFYIDVQHGKRGIQKSNQRQKDKDIATLEGMLKENPNDPRILYYLGQTYACLSDWDNACRYFKKRLDVLGCDEEDFLAAYRLGLAAEMASRNKPQMWPEALYYLLHSYEIRPFRAEPLVAIARYYAIRNKYAQAYLFARRAVELPYPDEESDLVEEVAYNFDRYDLLGASAYHVNEFDVGIWAVRQALKVRPNAPHLHRNLQLYLEAKAKYKEKQAVSRVSPMTGQTEFFPINASSRLFKRVLPL